MDDEKRFLTAVTNAGIQRVLVIDDALAPPEFRPEDDAGPLATILGNEALLENLAARGIDEGLRKAALDALVGSDFDEEEITQVWTLLYDAFIDRYVAKLDPGERFNAVKGDNARALRPFMKLLSKCDPAVEVVRVGGPEADVDFAVLKPQLIFLDYILNENVSAGQAQPDAGERQTGVKASRELLDRIIKELPADGPAVVLMSSYNLEKDETDTFRRGIGSGLFASRFQFVQKGKLAIVPKNKVSIEPDAAGTLLDLTQCRSFGVELNEALSHWRDGVKKAIDDVFDDIGDLELRDFAYLIRFRLADEGQPLSDYLEWFFGEVLLDRIGETVAWTHPSFAALNQPIDGPGRHIEGMFDGATSKIAEMFSRVRVDKRAIAEPRDRRMGDLYLVEGSTDDVRAVITPDCDLMHRKAGPRAKRMLTVSGKLHPIKAPNVTAADFMMHGKEPHSVEWDTKDLQTLTFGEARQHPAGMQHAGTMRPLYALELQRRVLDDVGRVGLAIAPALNYTALSTAFHRVMGDLVRVNTDDIQGATCSVMPSRGGSDKATIVFHRTFVTRLLAAIAALEYSGDDKETKAWVKKVKGAAWQEDVTEKLLGRGMQDGEEFEGVVVSIRDKPAKPKEERAFCQIVVQPMPQPGESGAAVGDGLPPAQADEPADPPELAASIADAQVGARLEEQPQSGQVMNVGERGDGPPQDAGAQA